MKRWMMIAIPVVLVVAFGSYGIMAQEESQTPQRPGVGPGMTNQGTGQGMQPGMGRGRMMGPGSAAHLQNCPLCGPMVASLMFKTMIPTQDGGVIIAFGDKLMRYDGQLKLIAETKMPIDPNEMYSSVQKMMDNCPVYRWQSQQAQAREWR